MYPDVAYIQGDIRNEETLRLAMVGHDVVVHMAAVKYIPVSEVQSIDTIDVNIYGSQVVCSTAVQVGVKSVIGISTDKACKPANLYGATKMAMEKIMQEYARANIGTDFPLVRYGNVLESTGSVIEVWKNQIAAGQPIKMTDPEMTRFWLSPQQAVGHILSTFEHCESGQIYVPLMPALSIGKLAEYTVGESEIERIQLRPGEKIHETLVTEEEWHYATKISGNGNYTILNPSTSERRDYSLEAYTSENAPRLAHEQLEELLRDG